MGVFFAFLFASPAHAQVSIATSTWEVSTSTPVIQEATSTPLTTVGLISHYSDVYDVSSTTVYKVLKCESKLNPKAVGDNGHSFGIAQIHLPSHPNITKKQAFDKEWAINWMTKQVSKGKLELWSCAQRLGYV